MTDQVTSKEIAIGGLVRVGRLFKDGAYDADERRYVLASDYERLELRIKTLECERDAWRASSDAYKAEAASAHEPCRDDYQADYAAALRQIAELNLSDQRLAYEAQRIAKDALSLPPRAAQPPAAEQQSCIYELSDGPFLTGCGHEFYLDAGQSLFDFCPHCGRPIEEVTPETKGEEP
jgi:hypothetical protein